MSELEQWEAEAMEFWRATGYMRPGKDDMSGKDRQHRQIAWDVWCNAKRMRRATEDRMAKDLAEAVALLDSAYGYTTASEDLLPERIKAFLAAQEKKP